MPLFLLAMTACSSQVKHAVAEQFRDKANFFDGQWTAYAMETEPNQKVDSWKLSCRTLFQQIPFNVHDGILAVNLDNTEYITNVSANGRFRLEIPTKLKPAASASSVDNLASALITLILQGTLRSPDPEGRFVVGISTFRNRGCTTQIRYLKTVNQQS